MTAELVRGAPVAAKIANSSRPRSAPARGPASPTSRSRRTAPRSPTSTPSIAPCAKAGLQSRRRVLDAGATQAELLRRGRGAGLRSVRARSDAAVPAAERSRCAGRRGARAGGQGRGRHRAQQLGAVLAGERRHAAPCTAAAVVELLASDPRLSPEGRDVCVIGRSLVVGRPLAAMLAAPLPGGQATVTLCHTRTADLAAPYRAPTARRSPATPTRPWPRWPGFLTPVPGGVGPVTNAVLLRHGDRGRPPRLLPRRMVNLVLCLVLLLLAGARSRATRSRTRSRPSSAAGTTASRPSASRRCPASRATTTRAAWTRS